jgi:hypothetical protein
MHSDWAVVDVWQAHQPGMDSAFPEDMASASYGLIVRPHWKTDLLALTPAAYTVLSALVAGETLGESLDAGLAIDADFDFASNLQKWLQLGIFADLIVAPDVVEQAST